MRTSIKALAAVAVAGGGLLIAAFALPAGEQPDAAAIYKQRCSMCHGADGKGFAAIKTPDFTDPKWQEGITDQEIADTIKNGKKGTAMPPFADKLKDDEIQALVTYIRSLNNKKSDENK